MVKNKSNLPLGMNFMEPIPDVPCVGEYDIGSHMWLSNGIPILMSGVTVTGSNASTGASIEMDTNEDFD